MKARIKCVIYYLFFIIRLIRLIKLISLGCEWFSLDLLDTSSSESIIFDLIDQSLAEDVKHEAKSVLICYSVAILVGLFWGYCIYFHEREVAYSIIALGLQMEFTSSIIAQTGIYSDLVVDLSKIQKTEL